MSYRTYYFSLVLKYGISATTFYAPKTYSVTKYRIYKNIFRYAIQIAIYGVVIYEN